jgi:ABC-type branched-chain amino acid transport system, permease component
MTKLARFRKLKRLYIPAFVVLLAISPFVFASYVNFQIAMIAVFAVAILGLNIITGYTGQVSLAQTAFVGLGAYTVAFGVNHGWPVIVTFVAAALLPALVGFLVALPAARLRGHSFAIVSIALPIVGIPLALRFPDITGGAFGSSISWMNAPTWMHLANDDFRFYVVIIIATVFFLLAKNLMTGRFQRNFAVVREDELVAAAMGVSPYRHKVLAFTIASMYGGIAGFLYMTLVQFVSPAIFGFSLALQLLAAMIIGGRASILGSLLGGALYVLLPVLIGQVDATQTTLLYGAVLLVILLVVPGGLVRIGDLFNRFRRNPPKDQEWAAPVIDTSPSESSQAAVAPLSVPKP